MSHLYGAILKASHTDRFTDWWTSSLPATRASLSQPQASDSAPKTHDIFGPSSQAEFAFCDPSSAILRMSKDTSPSDSERSLESWNQLVTRRRGEYSARVKSGRLISASACSSWPTIRASEYKDVEPVGSKSHDHMLGKHYLCAVVTQDAANWPTPDASNHRDGAVLRTDNNLEQGGFHGVSLHHAMTKYGQAAPASSSSPGSRQELSWMTPRACEAQNPPMGVDKRHHGLTHQVTKQWATPRSGKTTDENPETWALRQAKGDVATMPLTAQVKCWPTPASSGVTGGPTGLAGGSGNREKLAKMLPDAEARAMGCGKLNPRWVETLMGVPVGWVMPSCKSPVTIARTSCDSSATESCPPPQSELFAH